MKKFSQEALAINGGNKIATKEINNICEWPILTEEDETALLEVFRNRTMSQTDVTVKFEKEFAQWLGTKYALAHNNGTASIQDY